MVVFLCSSLVNGCSSLRVHKCLYTSCWGQLFCSSDLWPISWLESKSASSGIKTVWSIKKKQCYSVVKKTIKSIYHLYRNFEQTKTGDYLPSFGAETFLFQFAIYMYHDSDIKNYNFACSLVVQLQYTKKNLAAPAKLVINHVSNSGQTWNIKRRFYIIMTYYINSSVCRTAQQAQRNTHSCCSI